MISIVKQSVREVTGTGVRAVALLYADSVSELTDVTSVGDVTLLAGSVAYDKTGELVIFDSTDTWNTVQ